MISLETKISQSVYYGSVFLGLEHSFFTANELLSWLKDQIVTIKTKIAYKAVCSYLEINEQYLADGYHFLYKCPHYYDIAMCYNLDMAMPDRNDDLTLSAPIYFHLYTFENSSSINMSKFIVFGEGKQDYLLDNLSLCYLARNDPYFRNLTADDYNQHFLNSDWPSKLRFNSNLVEILIKRIQQLQLQAPIYYACVATKVYYQVAYKIYRMNLLTKISREQVKVFDNYFPNILSSHIFNYKDLPFKLALLNNDVAGYLLGFPIHYLIPNEKQLKVALDLLNELGIEQYCESLKKKSNVILANETDVLMENIDDYSPYDIVEYQTGEHMYRFSRAEFSNILQTKKNPWTNEDLHPTILSSMYARNLAAIEIRLPEAKILKDLLSNGVFESEIVPIIKEVQEVRQYDLDIIDLDSEDSSESSVSEEEIDSF
jgi:hypothetical protein